MTRREKRAKAFAQQPKDRPVSLEPTGSFSLPMDIDPVSAAFGGGNEVMGMMPKYEDIPDEFKDRNDRTYWNKLQSKWFFEGLDARILKPKPGIDLQKALRHLSAIQGSFTPKHEHKSAGVAYLMSLWFEE